MANHHFFMDKYGQINYNGETNKRIGLILDLPHDLAGLDLDASGSDPLDTVDEKTSRSW